MDKPAAAIDLRRKPKQSRSLKTVERVLVAAIAVLESRGFDGFSMQTVADEAGLAIGTLYQYFPDKYAILKSLVERWYVKSESFARFEGTSLPDIDTLAGIYVQEPGGSALFEAIQAVPELRAFDRSKVEEAMTRIAELLAKGSPPGPVDFARARVGTYAIDGVLRAAIRLPTKEAELMIEELKRWVRHLDLDHMT